MSANSAPAGCDWLEACPVSGSSAPARTAKTATIWMPRMQRSSAIPPAMTRARRRADGLNTRRPKPPASAAAKAKCIGGSTQPIWGGILLSLRTASEPIPPSRPSSSSQWNTKATRSGGAGDRSSAQHAGAGVEDSSLARRGAQEGLGQRQPSSFVGGRDRRGVVAQARLALERLLHAAVDERHVLELDVPHRELLPPADHDPVPGRVNRRHKPRSGLGEVAKAAPL